MDMSPFHRFYTTARSTGVWKGVRAVRMAGQHQNSRYFGVLNDECKVYAAPENGAPECLILWSVG